MDQTTAGAVTTAELRDRLHAVIDACAPLPVLDSTVQRVISLAEREDSTLNEIVEAIEIDPGFAADLLHLANSAHYARRMPARSVTEAVKVVGRFTLRRLALEAVAFRFFERAPGNGLASIGQLHLHAISVANVAVTIAKRVGVEVNTPHLAGLLHDCGKLLLPMACGDEEVNRIAVAHPWGNARAQAERLALGADHAYAGGLFAACSGVAPEVVEAVAFHHGGPDGTYTPSPAAACVQVANMLTALMAGASVTDELLDIALDHIGLSTADLEGLIEVATPIARRGAG